MRKIAYMAVAAAMAATLAGCAAGEEQAEQPGQKAAEQVSEEAESPKEQAERYVESVGLESVSEIYDMLGEMIDAMYAADVETVKAKFTDVEDKCNRIIDMQDVPEIAERAHGHIVDAVSCCKQAAADMYAAASFIDDDEKRSRMMASATENIEKFGESADKATAALDDMNRQVEAAEE